jgi:hypothetical protein
MSYIYCGYCGANWWPEQGHDCPSSMAGRVPARLGRYGDGEGLNEADVRRIVREELYDHPHVNAEGKSGE